MILGCVSLNLGVLCGCGYTLCLRANMYASVMGTKHLTPMLQGPEWFSSWLGLTDIFPVMVKLNLEPFVDIGGTLQTKIHLDSMVKNLTSQVVVVSICVHHRKPPPYLSGNILCPPELSLTIATNGSWAATKYFPFPEPGSWFLSFTVTCYNASGLVLPSVYHLNTHKSNQLTLVLTLGFVGIPQKMQGKYM